MQKQAAKSRFHKFQHFASLRGVQRQISNGPDEAADNPVLPVFLGQPFCFYGSRFGQFNQFLPSGFGQSRLRKTQLQESQLTLHCGQLAAGEFIVGRLSSGGEEMGSFGGISPEVGRV
jgi:hypothetical protein